MPSPRSSPRVTRSTALPGSSRPARTPGRAPQSLLQRVLDPQARMNKTSGSGNSNNGTRGSDESADRTLLEMAKVRDFAKQQEKETPRTNLRRLAAMDGATKVPGSKAFEQAGQGLSTSRRSLRSLPSRTQNAIQDDSDPSFLHTPTGNVHLDNPRGLENLPIALLRRSKRKHLEESHQNPRPDAAQNSLNSIVEDSIENTPAQTKNLLTRKSRKIQKPTKNPEESHAPPLEESNISSVQDNTNEEDDRELVVKRARRRMKPQDKVANVSGEVSEVILNEHENTLPGGQIGLQALNEMRKNRSERRKKVLEDFANVKATKVDSLEVRRSPRLSKEPNKSQETPSEMNVDENDPSKNPSPERPFESQNQSPLRDISEQRNRGEPRIETDVTRPSNDVSGVKSFEKTHQKMLKSRDIEDFRTTRMERRRLMRMELENIKPSGTDGSLSNVTGELRKKTIKSPENAIDYADRIDNVSRPEEPILANITNISFGGVAESTRFPEAAEAMVSEVGTATRSGTHSEDQFQQQTEPTHSEESRTLRNTLPIIQESEEIHDQDDINQEDLQDHQEPQIQRDHQDPEVQHNHQDQESEVEPPQDVHKQNTGLPEDAEPPIDNYPSRGDIPQESRGEGQGEEDEVGISEDSFSTVEERDPRSPSPSSDRQNLPTILQMLREIGCAPVEKGVEGQVATRPKKRLKKKTPRKRIIKKNIMTNREILYHFKRYFGEGPNLSAKGRSIIIDVCHRFYYGLIGDLRKISDEKKRIKPRDIKRLLVHKYKMIPDSKSNLYLYHRINQVMSEQDREVLIPAPTYFLKTQKSTWD